MKEGIRSFAGVSAAFEPADPIHLGNPGYDGAPLSLFGMAELSTSLYELLVRYRDFLDPVISRSNWSNEDIVGLYSRAISGDAAEVRKILPLRPDLKYYLGRQEDAFWKQLAIRVSETLMTKLAGLAAAYNLHTAHVNRPPYQAPALPAKNLVLAIDDQGKATLVRLGGASTLDPTAVTASLTVTTAADLPGVAKGRRQVVTNLPWIYLTRTTSMPLIPHQKRDCALSGLAPGD